MHWASDSRCVSVHMHVCYIHTYVHAFITLVCNVVLFTNLVLYTEIWSVPLKMVNLLSGMLIPLTRYSVSLLLTIDSW